MIARVIEREVERGLKAALRPAARYLRGVSVGLLLVAIAGGLGIVSVIGFGLAVFFALSPTLGPAGAALTLTGAGLLLTIILTFMGIQAIRPPRDE